MRSFELVVDILSWNGTSARSDVTDLNGRLNTGCSYGYQFDLTHTSSVAYLLSSIARELFTENQHGLG